MLRLALLAGLGAALGGMAFWNVYRFVVSRQQVRLRGLESAVRVAQLSDLHYGPFIDSETVSGWVQATMAERPDLIVLTGDFMDARSRRPAEDLFGALAPLSAPLGVWVTWGNHDHIRRSRLQLLAAELGNLGFGILTNRTVMVREDLQLAGLDDWRLGSPDLAGTLAQLQPGAARVLLSHNPDALPELPAGSVDLVLCGHTHGGQVSIPLYGALITGSRYGKRFAEGWVDAPVPAYVNRGLGVSGIPFRAFCPPEIAVMDLLPAG